MSKARELTCNDCYFRRSGLCALASDTPCPTFRRAGRNGLQPPAQPRLVPRSLAEVRAA